MYQARLYYDTRFNAINIPYDIDVLTNAAEKIQEFPTMDIITNMFLANIKIRITPPMDLMDLGHADYLEVYDEKSAAFYSITGMTPACADVLQLDLLLDPILTFNVTKLKISGSGFLERSTHHRPGGYPTELTIEDPLLTPIYKSQHTIYSIYSADDDMREMQGGTYVGGGAGGGDTIDIYGSSYLNYINGSDLQAATAPVKIQGTAGENYDVTFSDNFNTTRYSIGKPRKEKTLMTIGELSEDFPGVTREYPGLTFYGSVANKNEREGSVPNFLETAQTYYNFGIPNPIAVSYQIPLAFIKTIPLQPSGVAIDGYKNGVFSHITGITGYFAVNYSVNQFIAIKDKIDTSAPGNPETPVDLSETYDEIVCHAIAMKLKMKLIATGTGQEATITVNDLVRTLNGKLRVNIVVDPTPYGAPYYSWETRYNKFDFPTFSSEGAANIITKMYGSVRGATWQPAPVSMSNLGAQNELNSIAIRNSYAAGQSRISYDAAQQQINIQRENAAYANVSDLMHLPGQLAGANDTDSYTQFALDVGGIGADLALNAITRQNSVRSSEYSAAYSNMQRRLSIAQEMTAFNAAHQANVTNLMFPVSQSLPLFTGNGALIDIEAPARADIKRYIEIMQMYGVYLDIPIYEEAVNLIPAKTNIKKYCFLKTRGLNLYGNGPLTRDAAEAASGALNAGVRIWTTKPFNYPDDQLYKHEGAT